MSDTPGWASPGSTPSSEGREPGETGPAEPAEPGAKEPDASSPDTGAKWAAGQPPPAQWSAPAGTQAPGHTPPPPPPGPGWGTPPPGGYGQPGGYGGGYGTGGWAGGWGGPPPAAKPGIIPLRPLGIGEILDGAVSTMRTYWRTVLGISLTVAVVVQLVTLLLRGFVFNDTLVGFGDPSMTANELGRAVGTNALGDLVVGAVFMLGSLFATGLLTTVTSQAVLGRSVSIGEAWKQARPRLLRLFGLLLVLTALCLGVLAVGIAPGILISRTDGSDAAMAVTLALGLLGAFLVVLWLMVRYSLAPSALMLERQGVLKSMGRSTKLVSGSWWRIFGIQLLAWIITNIVSSILVIPFVILAFVLDSSGPLNILNTGDEHLSWSFLIISGIGSVLAAMITLPLNAGITVLLYIDQRIRREALDLELARAAGIQDHGTGPAPVPGG